MPLSSLHAAIDVKDSRALADTPLDDPPMI